MIFGQVALSPLDDTCDATFKVVSLSGVPLPSGRLTIHTPAGQTVQSIAIATHANLKLPCGRYLATITGSFIKTLSREIDLQTDRQFILLGTSGVSDDNDNQTKVDIRVRFEPRSSCHAEGRLIARLFSVYGNSSVDRELPSGGVAIFQRLDLGMYILAIVDGESVRATKAIKTWGPLTEVDVALERCRP